jgi:uncharacterized MAPEG superfamily protein
MTTAYICVLIMIVLPYFFVVLAKMAPGFNNATPRDSIATVKGWRKRAYWIQLNCFESFPPFVAAVIIAAQLQASQSTVDNLSMVFILSRVAHAISYFANKTHLRTLFWTIGFVCVIAIFVSGF